MASKNPITNPAFTKFVSALTATDQLSAADKIAATRDIRKAASRDRWEIYMTAEAAVHQAKATFANLCLARHRGTFIEADAEAAHEQAVAKVWSIARRWFAMPIHTKSDRRERRLFLNRATGAFAGSDQYPAWKEYRDRMKLEYA